MPAERSPQEMLARLSVPRLQELLEAQETAGIGSNRFVPPAVTASGASWIDFANAMVSIFAVTSRQPEQASSLPAYERPPAPASGEEATAREAHGPVLTAEKARRQ
mmetsp:Transcript_37013/g.83629  ORF Transcript_37013/g.83629 Transcript_37013/m.83629 type:complete len:106 (-) Transcript_37013:2-319(-)